MKVKKILNESILIVLGAFLLALGLNTFLLPFKLSSGGISSIATILFYFFKVPLSVTNLLFNAVLMVFGYKLLGGSSVIMVMYPPYVFHGERCGRIQKQRPGMFLNGSIYNHAASFKVFSDIKRGDFDEAYDTLMRCLPNHPDNSDTRRTSEPFSVGNVYYGPNHSRYGMNLFSWFTAAPSWLIHGGFEEILGVKAGFHGLELTPRVPADWSEYKVSKLYRGTMYQIQFIRSNEETGIWVDGQKQDGNVINSDKKVCDVLVKY